jgi:hypothetical protein
MPCFMVSVAQLVVAPGCGLGGRGFKSHRSPQKYQGIAGILRSLFISIFQFLTPFPTLKHTRNSNKKAPPFGGAQYVQWTPEYFRNHSCVHSRKDYF